MDHRREATVLGAQIERPNKKPRAETEEEKYKSKWVAQTTWMGLGWSLYSSL